MSPSSQVKCLQLRLEPTREETRPGRDEPCSLFDPFESCEENSLIRLTPDQPTRFCVNIRTPRWRETGGPRPDRTTCFRRFRRPTSWTERRRWCWPKRGQIGRSVPGVIKLYLPTSLSQRHFVNRRLQQTFVQQSFGWRHLSNSHFGDPTNDTRITDICSKPTFGRETIGRRIVWYTPLPLCQQVCRTKCFRPKHG
jgi:hypothetical protein